MPPEARKHFVAKGKAQEGKMAIAEEEIFDDDDIKALEEQGESFYVDQADAKRYRWLMKHQGHDLEQNREWIDKQMAQENDKVAKVLAGAKRLSEKLLNARRIDPVKIRQPFTI